MQEDETIQDDLKRYIRKVPIPGGHLSFFVGNDMTYVQDIATTIKDKFVIKYQEGEESEYLELSFVWGVILLVTNIVVNITLVYFTYIVLKLTKCGNTKINLLMLFMNLTLISDFILKIFVINENVYR